MGLTSFGPEVRALLGKIIAIDSDNYPEMMGHMCIINAPMAFRAIWKLVKPMLDLRTQSKIEVGGAGGPSAAVMGRRRGGGGGGLGRGGRGEGAQGADGMCMSVCLSLSCVCWGGGGGGGARGSRRWVPCSLSKGGGGGERTQG